MIASTCCRVPITGEELNPIDAAATSRAQNYSASAPSVMSHRLSISSLPLCAFTQASRPSPAASPPTSKSIASTSTKTGARASASCAAKEWAKLVLYEDAVGFVTECRWQHAACGGSGDVIEGIVLGVDAGDAHLEFVRVRGVVQ